MKYQFKIVSLILNSLIILTEALALIYNFIKYGYTTFRFYTYLSNIICFFSSLFFIIFHIPTLKKDNNNKEIPHWVKSIRYLATTCVTITMLMVVFILAPTERNFYGYLIEGNSFFVHILNPLLSLISFLFFEDNCILLFKETFIPLIATIIYGAISIIMNILDIYKGPYSFLRVTSQPVYMSIIWLSLILIVTYGLSFLLRFANFKIYKRLNMRDNHIIVN